ncbi:predicted protein [Histoplasma mississippiense (nom. inval.)]|uniref:predicted protein n=1 Tax=Ajellomyces capsulatus (strain NAm1 / WU24) TaxID=2059318 RepID=UPI000157D6AA|nr:predicted protein [Histoplasma mississippiense (nom. inval.)]EDN11442.1 predicted protein [Histoplasma mississippiense (nom. inval.)]
MATGASGIPSATQDEVDRSCQKVQFQQVFASRKGSHYIQIQTKETTEHTGTPDQNRASHVIDELERFYREQQRQTSNVIQAGEHDEANPWLRRTRWPVYLTNIAPNDLVEHEWTSAQYRFTPRQRKTWRVLWQVATTEGADQRHSISPDPMDEQMTEEEEEEEEKGQRDTQPEEEDKFKLTKMQMACLDFCIELLNQRVQVEDYECALVDALAVLGRGEYGWCDAESYPPMLSRIIKVARFMVVHKALRLDANASDMLARNQASQMVGEWAVVSPMEEADYTFTGNQNEGYESDSGRTSASSNPPSSPPTSSPRSDDPPATISIGGSTSNNRKQRSFQEWLELFMEAFMVRGTHSPMQWMLDLRTYGLKVHYSNTTPGHVGWMGGDELLYKDMHFTMGDFRGFTHGLVGATRRILREELLFENELNGQQPPAIPWSTMRDDPTQGGTGWNFLKDSRTRWPVDGAQWLMQQMRIQPGMQRRFIQREHSDRPRLAIKAINAYLRWGGEISGRS